MEIYRKFDLFRVNLGSAVNYVNLGSTLSEAILGLAPTNFGLAPSIRREATGFYMFSAPRSIQN
jgi:hypothetical protein